MPRFYVTETIVGDTASIKDPQQIHHLRDVLRLKIGDEITVFDVQGNEFLGIISNMEKKQIVLAVKKQRPASTKKIAVTIACAIPKKSKMDDIVDKLTQLGVDTIIPLQTERVIVKLDQREESRLERWRKIALNAAEQCQRSRVLRITPVMTLKEVLEDSGEYDLKLIPTLEAGQTKSTEDSVSDFEAKNKDQKLTGWGRKKLKDVLTGYNFSHILVLIGPEGDFTTLEIEQAIKAGFTPVSLGNSIMRVETAAIAIAAYISLCLEV